MPAQPRRNALAALAVISAFILYGSIYPFHFAAPAAHTDPLQFLLASLNTAPDRSDLMLNIIVYMPLGFFAARVFRIDLGSGLALVLASLLGALLSTGCEVTQFYVPERVPSASDVYANTIGATLGAFFGVLTGSRALSAWGQGAREEPFPTLLVASWLLYRLYPFVPVTSLRAYTQMLSPLYDYQFSAYDFIRYGATWLAVAAVAETIAGRQKAPRFYFFIAALVVVARLVVSARIVRPDEICGMAIGYVLWTLLLRFDWRRRALWVVLPLYLFVLLWRLEPFHFQAPTRPLSLELFQSFMNGSTEVNLQNFLVKVFYYGSLVWLTSQTGLRLRTATVLVAIFLLVTSVMELYLPLRSAEATDAAIAVVIGILIRIVNGASEAPRRSRPKARLLNPRRDHGTT